MLTDVPLQMIDERATTTEIFLYIGVKLVNIGPQPRLPPVVELIPRRFLLAFHHLVQQYLAATTSEIPSMEALVQSIRRPTIAEELQAMNELIGSMETALAEAERVVAIDPSARVVDILRAGTGIAANTTTTVASLAVTNDQPVAHVSAVTTSCTTTNTSTPVVAVDAVATVAVRHEQQIPGGSKDVSVPVVLSQPPPYRPTPLRTSRRLYSMSAADAHSLALRAVPEFITLDAANFNNMPPSKARKMSVVGPTKTHASARTSGATGATGAMEPAADISRRPNTLALRKCYGPARIAVSEDHSTPTSNSSPVVTTSRRVNHRRQATVAPVQRSADAVPDLRTNETYSSPAHSEADFMNYFTDPASLENIDYDPDFLRSVDELLGSFDEDKGNDA